MKVIHAAIHFNQNGTPFAEKFDDLYFSDSLGIEETQHVFLQHNQLPQRWDDWPAAQFVIAETGFGTGLNFLVTLALYAQLHTQKNIADFKLHFLTVEKYPLKKTDLIQALALYPELSLFSQELIEQYPINVGGCHRLEFFNGKVSLDLWLGDVHDVLPQWSAGEFGIVDCWYLDGFAPSKNPEMWTQDLFTQMARLAKQDCTYATFTAAGVVKRGLQDAGFSVEKQPGHSQKRHNLRGKLISKSAMRWPKPYFNRAPAYLSDLNKTNQAKIAVIGGGLAAANCAYALSQRGLKCDVYCQDATIAQGASGNHQGALYPHLNSVANTASQFHALAYLYASRFYRALNKNGNASAPPSFAHQWCGVIQLAFSDKVAQRYQNLIEQGVWSEELVRWLDPAEASNIANIELPYAGLFFPHGGWLNPPALVKSLFHQANTEVHCAKQLQHLTQINQGWQLSFSDQSQVDADIVILATGSDFANIKQLSTMPLNGVRGQVEHITSNAELSPLATVICHKGYLTPAYNNIHALGSTYIKGDYNCDYRVTEQSTNLNMHKKSLALSDWAQQISGQCQGRAAVRCGTADHLPMVGAIPDTASQLQQYPDLYKALPAQRYPVAKDYTNLYMLNGLGSRGLTTAPLLAEVLASQICAEPLPLPITILDALNPNRFLIRSLIRREFEID
ncbi:bifunctional tRNA (5-methylaminomethyl-2-thiouridine)(34)-methyltransferase MnmD/FAD-dependent 5-carboxymethylaminomethyl-2-thiouridine(34) oxidoreductase MnmC [Paraglaciecola hydrolytica]|uniref:tRNA 5-methylaminomethyl-2-thiouridine biosynthesis bifunctional protein MnmC n=1 Tax=Paraglaciecola hydrolytica TaxID=1799789 RepID=A0A136A2I6_9ALTE|nr:bifunctional tRNA (5-methylaminomethyl-2-thiouridine)(34)-methyltransferase MnmD/FAD-dependent 5-carboxymethylaminomethyl-2-thiouridine(34) oxidoreductase MnmC [Paraglaciecola hydrolytica]KXI29424.1 FAD-dependent cmnm(5)s(2)U34 oxidoreductase [Paraglaciecola hydrolytica]